MDTELFMECEEEELEPWQQVDDSVEEDDGDFMDYTRPVEDSPASTPPSESPPPPPAPPPPAPAPKPKAPDPVLVQSRFAPVSAAPSVSATSSTVAPPLVTQAQPIILSQLPRGAFIVPSSGSRSQPLLFTTQGFPVVNSGTPLLLNFPPGSTVLQQGQAVLKPGQAVLKPGQAVLKPAQPLTLIQSPSLGQLVRPSVAVTPVQGPAPSTTTTPGVMHLTIRTSTPERVNMAPVGGASSVTSSPALPSGSANGVSRTVTILCPSRIVTSAPSRVVTSVTSASSRVMTSASSRLLTSDPSRVVMSVEEFYYGFHEGDANLRKAPTAQGQSGTFPCHLCPYHAANNLRLMQHMLTHWRPIGRSDDRKSCKFCYRHFSSPLQLQAHLDQVHGPVLSNSLCRICEWAFENEPIFLNHMKSNHKPGEMPYVCQVCSYRSSFYSDVIQHFASFHRETRFLLCVFCLKISRNPGSYQQHLLRHQHEAFHCNRCRLQFIFLKDKIQHKQEHHRSFKRPARLEGLPPGSKVTIRTFGRRKAMVQHGSGGRPPQSPAHSGPGHAHSNMIQPISIKTEPQSVMIQKPTRTPQKRRYALEDSSPLPSVWRCVECGDQVRALSAHYPTHVRCLLCPYGSCCSKAYATHMIHSHHFPRSKDSIPRLNREPPPSRFAVVCSDCQFRPDSVDEMALHLALNPSHDSATCMPRVLSEPDLEFSILEPLRSDWSTPAPPPPAPLPPPSSPPPPPSPPPLVWSTPDCSGSSSVAEFAQKSGPSQVLHRSSDAIDFFSLLFPSALVELIVMETNAHVKTQRFLVREPLLSDWTPLSANELRGFLGLVIMMGLQTLPDLGQYWSYAHYDSSYMFNQVMSQRRFTQILQSLRPGSADSTLHVLHGAYSGPTPQQQQPHPAGKGPGPTPLSHRGPAPQRDPLRMFRGMLQLQGRAMWDAYKPNCCLALDRALLPGAPDQDQNQNQDPQPEQSQTKTSTALPQVWLLCDSKSGYCHRLHFQVSPGSQSSVVSELLSGLENQHHQLFVSNSVASVELFTQLHQQGIYASASFPRPHPGFPSELWDDRALENPGDFMQKQSGVVLATRWMDVKEMGCLSTNARPGNTDTVWRRSQSKPGALDPMARPEAFRLLQENMRGVDICKQLLACNPLGGVSSDRLWKNLFWFLVNVSIVNAFIVLRESRKENPPGWVHDGLFTQVRFRRRLGMQLAKCFQRQSPVDPPQTLQTPRPAPGEERQRHRMAKISRISKRCRNCHQKNIRHESVHGCVVCRINLCKQSSCFWELHGLSRDIRASTKVGFWMNNTTGEITFDKPEERVDDVTAPVEDFSDDDDDDEEHYIKTERAESPESLDQSFPTVLQELFSERQLQIALCALCEGVNEAARVFCAEPQLIRNWLSEANEKIYPDPEMCDVNDRMVKFVLSTREQELALTYTSLFNKVSALKKKGSMTNTFRFSYDWAVSFMLQNKLAFQSLWTRISQTLPPTLNARVESFQSFTQKVFQTHSLTNETVAAMDELCLFADLSLVGNKSRLPDVVRLRGVAPLVTVYLAALADGTVLPSLLLANVELNEKSLPEFVFVEAASENAEDSLDLWRRRVWSPHVHSSRKSMLILDAHREHDCDAFMTSVSEEGTLPALIPQGLAFRLQPLEVCVKPVVQHYLLKRWSRFVEGEVSGLDEASVTKLFVEWTIEALTQINELPEIVRKSFKVTGVVDEVEDGENVREIQIELMKTLSKALLGEEMEVEEEQEPQKTFKTEEEDREDRDKMVDSFRAEPLDKTKERENSEEGKAEDKMAALEDEEMHEETAKDGSETDSADSEEKEHDKMDAQNTEEGGEVNEEGEEGGKVEGKVEGKEEGKEKGQEEGQEEGKVEGKVEGKEEGKEKGQEEGKVEGKVEGKEKGQEEGKEEGKEKGQEEGKVEGKEKGQEAGKEKGQEAGKVEGKEKGEEEGEEEGEKEGEEKGQEAGKVERKEKGQEAGKVEGKEKGEEEGKEKGQDEGKEKGQEEGKVEGKEKGEEEGEKEGKEKGQEEGKVEGKEKGEEEGKEKGQDEGKEKKQEEGKEKGQEEEKVEGKEKGEEEGQEEGKAEGKEKGDEKGEKEGKEKGEKEGKEKGEEEGKEEGKENGKEAEDAEEVQTERRETRIVIGAELGDEWQVTVQGRAEDDKMDES